MDGFDAWERETPEGIKDEEKTKQIRESFALELGANLLSWLGWTILIVSWLGFVVFVIDLIFMLAMGKSISESISDAAALWLKTWVDIWTGNIHIRSHQT